MPDEPHNQKRSGVHVAKGTALRIPAGGLTLSFGTNGQLEMKAAIEVLQVMTPHWLGIAVDHLDAAKRHHHALVAAVAAKTDAAIGTELEAEFLASMQAAVAAAIALDALYASVKEHVTVPQCVVDAWRKNGTTRYSQVVEVLKRGFKLKNQGVQSLGAALKSVFAARDSTVHPMGRFSAPMFHPDLRCHTEWRFVQFRYHTVHPLVSAALAWTKRLAFKGSESTLEGLATLSKGISGNLDSLVPKWEERHGKLSEEAEKAHP